MKTGMKKFAIAGVAAVAVLATMGEGSSSGDSESGADETTSQEESGSSDEASDEEPAEEEPAEEEASSEFGIGDPARDGKFEFVVSGVECGADEVGGEFLSETAQGQFCLVTMSVTNIGDESQLFDAGSQKGVTNTGATVDADSTASLYANEESESFLESINPGNSIQDVVVVYDIAPDQTLEAVELYDSLFSNGVTVALS